MFENLQEKLQRAFKTLRGQAVLNEENIQEAMREIRLALLEADVNFKVVKQLIDQVQAKAVGQEVMTALSPGEQVIKIVHDELVQLLGKDTARMKFASQPPTVVLMAGLQGSGKTTTSGKLANWLKNGGHRPLLVSVDVYRPAAREQLKVVAQAIKANIYEGEVTESNTATVERLAKEARNRGELKSGKLGLDMYGLRNKLKALREALRAGPAEVRAFCQAYQIGLLPEILRGQRGFQEEGWLFGRCGYFDALELLDHYLPLELAEANL